MMNTNLKTTYSSTAITSIPLWNYRLLGIWLALTFFFLIGAACPVILWLITRRYPNSILNYLKWVLSLSLLQKQYELELFLVSRKYNYACAWFDLVRQLTRTLALSSQAWPRYLQPQPSTMYLGLSSGSSSNMLWGGDISLIGLNIIVRQSQPLFMEE